MAGAAGGQLFDIACPAKRLVAIDKNVEAFKQYRAALAANGAKVEIPASNFKGVSLQSDVVYFEFCLAEADAMLLMQRPLLPRLWYPIIRPIPNGASAPGKRNNCVAVRWRWRGFGLRRQETFSLQQRFKDHAELSSKMATQWPLATERVQRFAAMTSIVIPMPCQLILL